MYTTVLSLGAAPSVGSRCTKPVTRSAECHSGSVRKPSMVIGCARRIARTCCGAVIGESTGTAGGYTAARSRQNESVVVIEPGWDMDGGPGRGPLTASARAIDRMTDAGRKRLQRVRPQPVGMLKPAQDSLYHDPQDPGDLLSHGQDLLVRQQLPREPRGGVRDGREPETPYPPRPRGHHLGHGRHAHGVGAEPLEHPHFGRGLVGGPEEPRVHALLERNPGLSRDGPRVSTQLGVVRLVHERKALLPGLG